LILFDINKELCEAWERHFAEVPKVSVLNVAYQDLPAHDCVVAPGNSFGLMDGGFDGVLTARYGKQLMQKVQIEINGRFAGMQPVGTSFTVLAKGYPSPIWVAHTPTMLIPMDISGTDNVYRAMTAMLLEVRRWEDIKTVACPGLGTCTGKMPVDEAARQMALAYQHFLAEPPFPMTWDYALTRNAEIVNNGR